MPLSRTAKIVIGTAVVGAAVAGGVWLVREHRELAGLGAKDPFGNEIVHGTILYVGKKRKDGKTPVTFVFLSSGARINKLLSTEQLDAEIAKAPDVRRK